MDILGKQEFVQTIVIMAPKGSRPSCAGSFATLIRGLVVRTGADGSRRSLRRLMNYDNVAPEGESLLRYLLGCADAEFGDMMEEDGARPSHCWRLLRSCILPLGFPRPELCPRQPLANYTLWFKIFCGGLKDTDSLASCASPAFTSKQTSNASGDQPKRRLPWQMEFIILTILPQRKRPLCQVTQAICPDSLTNPNTLLMGTGTPWCCYRRGCLLSAKSQRNTLREPKIPDLVRTSVWRTIGKKKNKEKKWLNSSELVLKWVCCDTECPLESQFFYDRYNSTAANWHSQTSATRRTSASCCRCRRSGSEPLVWGIGCNFVLIFHRAIKKERKRGNHLHQTHTHPPPVRL